MPTPLFLYFVTLFTVIMNITTQNHVNEPGYYKYTKEGNISYYDVSETTIDKAVIIGSAPLEERFRLTTIVGQDVSVKSWKDLAKKFSKCPIGIRLIILQDIDLADEELKFMRSADPTCFKGEVFVNLIDFSDRNDIFQEWLKKIKPTRIQLGGIKGLINLSTYMNTLPGLNKAGLLRVISSKSYYNQLSDQTITSKEKISMDAIFTFLHATNKRRWKWPKMLVIECMHLDGDLENLVKKLVEKFKNDSEGVSYVFSVIGCPDLPESPALQYKAFNKLTNERWLVKSKAQAMKEISNELYVNYGYIPGRDLSIIRQNINEQSMEDDL